MGCGTSKRANNPALDSADTSIVKEDEIDQLANALSAYLAVALDVSPTHPEILRYVAALNSEGWDKPTDFDDLTVDELRENPFNFKAGHLKKVRTIFQGEHFSVSLSCTHTNTQLHPPFFWSP